MQFRFLALPAVILLAATSLVLLVTPSWRRAIIALAVQYLAVFLLVVVSWPIEMALTKLVAGWIAAFVLSMALVSVTGTSIPALGLRRQNPPSTTDSPEMISPELLASPLPARAETPPQPSDRPLAVERGALPEVTSPGLALPSGRLLRLLSAALVAIAVFSIAPRVLAWVSGVLLEQVWGSLLLFGIGLLQLGFTSRPLRTVLGLLTIYSGFEILYAVMENSLLVAGLLSGVTLALSLAGAYLLMASAMEEGE